MSLAPLPPRILLGLILLTLFWGLNWPIMKLSLRELTPLYFRAVTMSGGLVLLLLWCRRQRISLRIEAADLSPIALLAVPNILGWHMLSIFGVQALASGRAAILGFTMPVFTVLLGAAFFGQRLTPRTSLATLAAASAVALLLWHEAATLAGQPLGAAWMLGAAASWALGTLLLKRIPLALPTLALTIWMIGLCLPVLWLMAWALEPGPSWTFSAGMWLALAYGCVINYGVAQILWFSIARTLPPAASGLSIMAVPVIGLGSAMWIVDEQPYPQDYLATGLILVALALVLIVRRR